MPVRPAIIPNLRYADAPAAIDFLRRAFGFTVHAVFRNEADPAVVDHAQLTLADQMIMLATAQNTPFSERVPMRTPREAGGNTMALYVVLEDVDGHYARAKAAGADIMMEPNNPDYGGRGYSARDPEGYAWSFGSYDPFA